ncbi:MAG: DUF1016 domain-containing protein [Verrucomicrobia bacterium]|nr:DUF1016 domain-containing protein [Verrucomicrobiota bacterium]
MDGAWLRTYHETGRLIHEHLLLHKERADYGAKVVKRLAADPGIDKRTLYECAQFYRFYPIVRTCAQLGWGHYRLLCQVAEDEQRARLCAAMAIASPLSKRLNLPTSSPTAQPCAA